MQNQTLQVRNLTLCALFAALTAICSQIAIPIPPIPINLALLSVYLSGALLGARLGALSQLVFMLVGAVGMPVFSGFRGGIAVLVGPTGGYIIGYLAAAWIIGFICEKWGCNFYKLVIAILIGTAVCYAFGTAWFVVLTGKTLVAALGACVLPFLPGDAAKTIAAAAIVPAIAKVRVKMPAAEES
ncbi:MAG: biotin transporter BioY [Anaerotruncus sp.]|nr:biotin transporter BioY [Anaerotruncus sp.]